MTDTKPRIRVPSNMAGPAFTADGLVNFASGLGTSADKSWWATYAVAYASQMEIDAAYRTSWFRKICDIPPFDEVREWREWTGAEADQITAIDNEEKRLGLRQKVAEARTLARKDGGALLVMGFGPGDAATPLDPETVRQNGLQYLTVLSRKVVSAGERNRDVTSPYFDTPEFWTLGGEAGRKIHASRVVRFIGNPMRDDAQWNGWGESIWIELRDAIRNADQIANAIAALTDEAKVDVFRLKNFMSLIATGEYEAILRARFGAMATAKSSINALLLDQEDEYEQKSLTFAGLTDIQKMALAVLAGRADIPATRMLGQSPDGMNATGDSDMRNYYDRVRAGQVLHLGPALTPVDQCLVRSALGDYPEELYYNWNPLYSLNETEAAAVEKTMMEVWTGYANAALIPDTALAAGVKDGLVERGNMPGIQQAFDDAETEGDLPGLLAEPTEAELAAEAAQTAIAKAQAANPTQAAFPKPRLVASKDARFIDATPRTLYVRRDVVNKADIRKWAEAQGFTDIVPDLHVTIISSRAPVDWMKMGESWSSKLEITAGGPRLMDNFGPEGNTRVLLFAASELRWRHDRAIEAGASFDFAEYQPHITIQKGGDIDLSKVTPYQGKIVLGAEIFEEVKAD